MGCLSVRTVDEVIIANKIKNKDNMIIFDEEQKFKLNVHALIKVIESKNNNPEQIKDNIEEVFNNSLKNKQKNINKGEIIQKISEIFISYLSPLSVNNEKKVKNIINLIYEKNQNIDDFKEYLINIYEEINDYSKLKKEEENKISNYFIRILEKNEKIINNKDKLINQYKDNSIIKYEDFAKIIKQYEIVLEPIIMDYLLYKMKCGLSLETNTYDNFNVKQRFEDYLLIKNSMETKTKSRNDKDLLLLLRTPSFKDNIFDISSIKYDEVINYIKKSLGLFNAEVNLSKEQKMKIKIFMIAYVGYKLISENFDNIKRKGFEYKTICEFYYNVSKSYNKAIEGFNEIEKKFKKS